MWLLNWALVRGNRIRLNGCLRISMATARIYLHSWLRCSKPVYLGVSNFDWHARPRHVDSGISFQSFNHCITFVPLQRDTLWLECTADLIAAGELPSADEGCDVLVVKENAGEIVRTPQSMSGDNCQISTIKGHLTASGKLTFRGSYRATGNIATRLRHSLRDNKGEDRKRYLGGRLGRYLPVLDLATYEIDHLLQNFDQPLEVRVSGTSGKFGARSAKRLFVNPNILNRVRPGSVPRAKKRQFSVYYSYPYTYIDIYLLIYQKVMYWKPRPIR